ncbi:tRNA modification GTPase [Marixanthomonas spongiae]|uniref:tRNA modification GTPase n=1 Tax=Marixanthomonas spongiae TaxID=2174845 RepID=A0A2U0HYU8_9FLAO|nr:tRNA modification GTPase [Marixanthomonas spongiae]PVW13920.1 tRNA modification GTPase [Marixanthomonas spongiae]
MKNTVLILLVSFFSLSTYAQIKFEKGYFINNQGNKVNCLIKNVDWRSNPKTFEYKASENQEVKTANIAMVKEFMVSETQKYERHTVNIDRSTDVVNRLGSKKAPEFKEEQLFLRVLVEGKATLYLYRDSNLTRYFYKIGTQNVEQLVYKRYKETPTKMGVNNQYKQQLWNNLKCSDFSMNTLEKVDYNSSDLSRFFVKYNQCAQADYTDYTKNKNKLVFNFTVRPGVRSSSLIIANSARRASIDFGNATSFRFGLEGEFKLPFNKNKWAIIVEPTYQYYKPDEVQNPQVTYPALVKTDYKSIELPFGLRHYFFLNDKSKIFVNASYVIDFSLKSNIDFEIYPDLEISRSTSNFAFGLGYNFNDRYSAEVRLATERNIMGSYVFWGSDYKSVSFILGYTLF